MQNDMRVAFDMSSVMWTCLCAGKDREGSEVFFEGRKVQVNTAAYGYENAVNHMVSVLNSLNLSPMDTILVFEGRNSKAPRLMIDREYKAKRGKRPPAAYDAFNEMKEKLMREWRALGAVCMSVDNVEGDDVLGWLAVNTRQPLVISTNDNDLSRWNMLNQHGQQVQVRVDGELARNKYGMFDCKFITLYKAMVGDTGDGIKGIPGFGAAAWLEFDTRFGERGMQMLTDMAEKGSLDELESDALKDKFIRKIFDGRHDLIKSYKLARMYPEWVDTMKNPITWMPGFVNGRTSDMRLQRWSASRRLVTANNWASFVPWALKELERRPWYGLDIETSTPPESDDWLAAQGSDGVDVIGSKLTGMSLTFGRNMQFTVYISIDHADTANVTEAQLLEFLKQVKQRPVIHNTMFEGPVLWNTFGAEWLNNGWHGFLPNWYDTKLEASYVDENHGLGLKFLSKHWLNYEQVNYDDVTTFEVEAGTPYPRGAFKCQRVEVVVPAVTEPYQKVDKKTGEITQAERIVTPAETRTWDVYQCKMNELTAEEAFDYACDDTATCTGLHNFFQLFMMLEGTWEIYQQVELDASYLHAQSFVHGTKIDLAKRAELVKEDDAEFNAAKQVVDAYLVKKGWAGTICPVFTEIDAAAIKFAYELVMGEPLKTMVRTPSKIIDMIKDTAPTLAGACTDVNVFNEVVKHYFTGAPDFNTGSPLQMQKLFYEVMELPIRVFNKPTEKMKAEGRKTGTPKTDNLAIAYALREEGVTEEVKAVLKSLQVMKMVSTRRGLFYDPYPYFVHWKTGRVHSQHNQCATNTRRASSSKPNLQQLSKHAKVEGFSPRVREMLIPHKRNAVVVSFDFSSQEIVLMAHWSQDPELLSLFIGDNRKDMHCITGVGIYNAVHGSTMTYEEFDVIRNDKSHPEYEGVKYSRMLGKQVNFGSQYRIAAKKLSSMLFVLEEEAQVMLDAKAAAFPVAEEWSLNEMSAVREVGVVHTLMGAVRHLREALQSDDFSISGKAERQALSFRIQGSAAEQTKLAEGRMWKEALEQRFDCEIIGPVHDEVVVSVAIEDLVEFLPVMHKCMVAPYSTMTVPVRSSISLGPDFGRQIEMGEEPTREAINEAFKLGFSDKYRYFDTLHTV